MKNVIKITYRNLEGMHVFTSHDVAGLYVANRDLANAYKSIPCAILDLTQARYQPAMSASAFVSLINRSQNLELPVVLAANNIVFKQSC